MIHGFTVSVKGATKLDDEETSSIAEILMVMPELVRVNIASRVPSKCEFSLTIETVDNEKHTLGRNSVGRP